MYITVVVTTYNRPDALRLVLSALDLQTDKEFEVIVADDGSLNDTRMLIEQMSAIVSFPLMHAWQRDDGFRAARARNLAVKHSSGDYFLFLDGDCLPMPTWVQNHRSLAERRWAVVGNRVLLSDSYSDFVLKSDSAVVAEGLGYWFERLWNGDINRIQPLLTFPFPFWRRWFSKSWNKLRSCNFGICREDFELVNGFDSSFCGWGLEDSDLAVRLMNAGVGVKLGYFSTPVLHLWHREYSREREELNRQVVFGRLLQKVVEASDGLRELKEE